MMELIDVTVVAEYDHLTYFVVEHDDAVPPDVQRLRNILEATRMRRAEAAMKITRNLSLYDDRDGFSIVPVEP